MSGMRNVAKRVLPKSVIVARRHQLLRRTREQFRDSSNAEIFSTVYAENYWGIADGGFNSGDGSHDPAIYAPYVDAVREFLVSLPNRPDVVDLGCGDFNVARQIRPFCAGFVACDVVPTLIERNRRLPETADVEFRCVDITVDDPLPPGDVVIIRQVLQHLANAEIAKVVPKLHRYRYAIVTDHQPEGEFVPNVDIPSGPHIRVGLGSGLDLAQEPFRLPFAEARELCVVPGGSGVIRTILYSLQ